MKSNLQLLAHLVVFIFLATSCFADEITFNGTEPDGAFTFHPIGTTLFEGDFQIEITEEDIFTVDNDFDPGLAPADDDVLFFQLDSGVTISRIDGQEFSFNSVDLIGSFGGSGTLLFVGNFLNGGSISGTADAVEGALTTTAFSGFDELVSLDIVQRDTDGNFLSVDTIRLNQIPEPGSLGLLSVCGIALLARRRK